MLGGLLGGGGGDKGPKTKIGGTKINCIDANKSSSHHGGKFQGKNKGSGNGMGNVQNGGGMNQGMMGNMMGGIGNYMGMGGAYGNQMGGNQMAGNQMGGNQMGNWMGNIDNFFGGSFFVQLYAKKSDKINALLPQIADMDDQELLMQMSSVSDMSEQELLAEINKDFGWDQEKTLT